MPYLTGGYPTLEGASEVGEAYLEAGADVLEIGVPFSDPLADGPTIQKTTTRALANGADLDYCLDLASGFSGRVPVVFLLYYNVIFARGVEQFLQEAAEAGVSGHVIPDLPVDEAGRFAQLAAAAGVAFCPLVAPTSTDRRVSRVGEMATGFVYCVSVAGVTGVRDNLPPGAVELEARSCEDRCAGGAGLRYRFGRGCCRGRRGSRWNHHRKQAHAARRGGRAGEGRRGCARCARRSPGSSRLGARHQELAQQTQEYSRSAPETESGVGPMDAVFTKCDRCGQPIYEKDLRARFNVCPNCEFHYPLSAPERIRLLQTRAVSRSGTGASSPKTRSGSRIIARDWRKARQDRLDDAILSGTGAIGGGRSRSPRSTSGL